MEYHLNITKLVPQFYSTNGNLKKTVVNALGLTTVTYLSVGGKVKLF